MKEEDGKRLRRVGLREEEIREGAAISACFNCIDRIADAFGVPLDPEYQRTIESTGRLSRRKLVARIVRQQSLNTRAGSEGSFGGNRQG